MSNVYYKPEKYGLSVIAEAWMDFDDEFERLVVWGDKVTGELFYADDTGCWCCGNPFDALTERAELVQIHSVPEFTRTAREWAQSGWTTYTEVYTQLGAMMVKIRGFENLFDITLSDAELEIDPEDYLVDGN